jgi:hypothetical protein
VAVNQFVKIVVGGAIATTDRWSCGFAFRVSGGTPSAADMNGIASGFATIFATDFWDHTNGGKVDSPTTTSWDKCSTYFYPAGSATSTISGTVVLTPDFGSTAGVFIPPECAIVASLHTGFTGRQNRGRLYLPCPTQLVANGQLASTVCTNWATQIAQVYTHWNSATVGALAFDGCIGTGETPIVTKVTIDSVVDSQRRRRNKQIPSSTGSGTV